MKLAHTIDANGFMLEPVLVEDDFANTSDTIVNTCPDGFYKPKWDGSKWVDALPLTDAQILQQSQGQQIALLGQACGGALATFQSSALGSPHTYLADDQSMVLLNGEFSFVTSSYYDNSPIDWYTKETNGYAPHTVAQFVQVYKDGRAWVAKTKAKMQTKQVQVNTCKTIADVQSIVWNDTTAPSVPTGLTSTSTKAGQVTLNWTQNSEIDVQIGGNYNIYQDGTKVGTVTSPTDTITGLTSGGTHNFTITAVDSDGNESAQSTDISVTVM